MVVRGHREKLGDVRVVEGESVGRWLAVVSRAVVGSVREGFGIGEGGEEVDVDVDVDVGDWNVVQNNGMGFHDWRLRRGRDECECWQGLNVHEC